MIQNLNYGMNGIIGEVYYNTFLFNDAAGNLQKAKEATPEEFKEMLLSQARLVQEELNELIKGIEENNVIEQLDGAGDSLVTVSGLVQLLETKVKAEAASLEVTKNNLTKFVSVNHPDIQNIINQTCGKYQKEGKPVDVVHNTAYNCIVFVDRTTRKVKKPFGYKSVDLSSFV